MRKNTPVRLLAFFLLLIGCWGPSTAAAQQPPGVHRVDPPHWWVGMKTVRTVELMVHQPGIAAYAPSLQHPGVKIRGVYRGDSPNYLFVEIEISAKAKPGTVPFVFSQKGKPDLRLNYLLKARKKESDRAQGIRTSDVMYLLFPDRFANGDPSNDLVRGMTTERVDRKEMYLRHGGDLKGATEKLDYLRDLGVSALWLNPVFENNMPETSYHGYAITDFYRVDRRLGTGEEYRQLVDSAHAKGIKIVKDIVYNHVGNECFFFKDQPEKSWFNEWDSFTRTTYREPVLFDPYAAQSDVRRMADGWFDRHMPDLDQRNPRVARYLTQASFWWVEEYGIDAYRVDTWVYPDQKFMDDLARALLAEYPKLGFFGETWVHGVSTQAFFMKNRLRGGERKALPAVTDFQLYYGINDALTREQGWTDGAAKLYYTLAKDFLYEDPYRNVTFLDNHDLSRFYSVVGENPDKFKQGIGLLMTLRGIPCLYYGTEVLMKNFSNPDGLVREDFPGGFPGDPVDKFSAAGRSALENECWNYVRALARYRRATPALQDGKLVQFVPEDGVYVFFRYDRDKTVMVVLNTSAQERTIDLTRFAERTAGFKQGVDAVGGGVAVQNLSERRFPVKGTSIGIYELR